MFAATRFQQRAGRSLGDPTVADAVLDRLVHNAYKLDLRGNSKRKERGSTTNEKQ